MTLSELNQSVANGKVAVDDSGAASGSSSTAASPSAQPTPSGNPPSSTENTDVAQYIPVLVQLQSIQQWLSAAPTFTPKTLADQIQFVFDGTTYSLYFWANNQWNQIEVGGSADYGDGSDSTVVLDGTATFGFASLVGSVYTLNRDIFAESLTINSGVTIRGNGFKIYSQTPIALNGTYSLKSGSGGAGTKGGNSTTSGGTGSGGAGGSAATGIPSGSIKQPGGGRAGTAGLAAQNGSPNIQNGVAGTNEANCCQANNAAAGGNSGSGSVDTRSGFSNNASTGGPGGTATQTTKISSKAIATSLVNALGAVGCNPTPGSGAGGGGGVKTQGGDSAAGGGGGGGSAASGGFGFIAAPSITVGATGVIIADGGDGGPGGAGGDASGGSAANYGGGGGGGGAPGNGGFIILFTPAYVNNGTATANAGAVGTGGAAGLGTGAAASSPQAGSNSAAGSNGTILQFIP